MTPVALFDVENHLVERLEHRLGPPLDSYLMGWQVWLEPAVADDPNSVLLEYRLHPPADFVLPDVSHHDLWDDVVSQIAEGASELQLGTQRRTLGQLWTLLEVFPAHGDPATPEQVRAWAEQALGLPALGCGAVDHERLGGRWRRARHRADVPAALRAAVTG